MSITVYPFWGGGMAGDLAPVATSGAYSDLTGRPTLGSAAATDATAYATAAQGALAATALQPSAIQSSATDETAGRLQRVDWLGQAPAILDSLRRSVEQASGGLNTVLYNSGGDPCYVRILPVIDYASLGTAYTAGMGTGTLEAFLVGGVQKPWIGIGLYPAGNVAGRVVSQPGLDPWNTINYDEAVAACAAMGSGWRLMSVWDWAAVTHQCMARGYQPKGNTDYGRAHDAKHQGARRIDGGLPGVTTGTARTLSGSGPDEWNHDNSPAGIADLVGNVWEWLCGAKITEGAVSLAADNGGATTEASWASAGFTLPASRVWSTVDNTGAPDTLKRALIVPAAGVTSPQGHLYTDLTSERLPIRGGSWSSAGNAGLAALSLNNARDDRSPGRGFRPVFVP